MVNSKIKTYFNFLKRSNKIIYGYDQIKNYNKKAYLIISSYCFSDKEKLIKKASLLNCKLYETDIETLSILLETQNCKAILIKNFELAKAILKENNNLNLLREVNLIESNTKQ